jgi:hypothetical protein
LFDQVAERGTRIALPVKRGTTFVSLGRLQPSSYELSIDSEGGEEGSTTFVAKPAATEYQVPTVEIRLVPAGRGGTGGDRRLPLHSRSFAKELSALVIGETKIADIVLPSGVRLCASIESQDGHLREIAFSGEPNPDRNATKESLAELNQLACGARRVELDAGSFGRAIYVGPEPDSHSPVIEQRPLSHTARARAKWLLGMVVTSPRHRSGSVTQGAHDIRESFRRMLPTMSPPDRKLISQLVEARSYPEMITPHLRSLALQLSRLGADTSTTMRRSTSQKTIRGARAD